MKRAKLILVLAMALALLVGCAGPTRTAAPTAAPTPASTAMPTSLPQPTTVEPTTEPTAAPADEIEVTVYFADTIRFAAGTLPFEAEVTRKVPATASLPEAVLQEYFKGPTADERARGLEALTSGFTGYSALKVEQGIAHVYLTGPCSSGGATYTIAQPLMKNLLQFDEIQHVKIYDADGTTGEPKGQVSSIPGCLEP